MRKIQREEGDLDLDEYEDGLMEAIDKLEDDLMGVEMKLQDVLSAATSDFIERVRKTIEEMKNKTSTYIAQVAAEAEQFNTGLRTYAVAEADRFMEQFEKDDVNAEAYIEIGDNNELLDLMTDRDALISHLEASKENVDAKINDKDTEITKAIQEDWNAAMSRIQED